MPRKRYNREYKPPSVHDLLKLPPGNRPGIAAMVTPTSDQLLDLLRDLMAISGLIDTNLYQRLRWNIMGQALRKPWVRKRRDHLRWDVVRWYVKNGQSIEQACKAAAAALKGTPAAAGPDQMKKTYLKIQKDLKIQKVPPG
jgi:hypothetical protein